MQLHLATALFGLAGTISQLSNVNVLMVVEARAGLAALALLFWAHFTRTSIRLGQGQGRWFLVIGLLLAFHWYSFFLSMRLTSVAVGLLTFSCFPLFVIMLAPLIDRSCIRSHDLVLVAVLLLGLSIVLPNSGNEQTNLIGALWGGASGLSFAIIQIINRRLVQVQEAVKISIYQNAVAAIALLPFVDVAMLPGTLHSISQLLFLGLICTAVAHTLFIASMRRVSAQTASMFTYLEPVYGIGMAALLLGEIPTMRMLVGGMIILIAIFFATRNHV